MHALCHSRGIGRLLAAWLLLWFVTMPAAPSPLLHAPGQAGPGHAGESRADCTGHDAHAGHPGQACTGTGELHAGDEGNAANPPHCPVCLHVSAPPAPPRAAAQPNAAPDPPAGKSFDTPLGIRTAAPPPARGPPRRA